MNYLLDTCVLSEFVKPAPLDNVQVWLAGQEESRLFVSAITLAELHRGVARMAPSRRRQELDSWLERVTAGFDDRILPFTRHTASCWGSLCATAESRGKPLSLADSLIAASALEHGLTLVTRNERDFISTPVTLFNPWTVQD